MNEILNTENRQNEQKEQGTERCPRTLTAPEIAKILPHRYPFALVDRIEEALAQTGAVALLDLPEYKGKIPLFGGVQKARFRRQVVPGDVVELSCEITERKGPVGIGKAVASVDGKKVCDAQLLFAISAD